MESFTAARDALEAINMDQAMQSTRREPHKRILRISYAHNAGKRVSHFHHERKGKKVQDPLSSGRFGGQSSHRTAPGDLKGHDVTIVPKYDEEGVKIYSGGRVSGGKQKPLRGLADQHINVSVDFDVNQRAKVIRGESKEKRRPQSAYARRKAEGPADPAAIATGVKVKKKPSSAYVMSAPSRPAPMGGDDNDERGGRDESDSEQDADVPTRVSSRGRGSAVGGQRGPMVVPPPSYLHQQGPGGRGSRGPHSSRQHRQPPSAQQEQQRVQQHHHRAGSKQRPQSASVAVGMQRQRQQHSADGDNTYYHTGRDASGRLARPQSAVTGVYRVIRKDRDKSVGINHPTSRIRHDPRGKLSSQSGKVVDANGASFMGSERGLRGQAQRDKHAASEGFSSADEGSFGARREGGDFDDDGGMGLDLPASTYDAPMRGQKHRDAHNPQGTVGTRPTTASSGQVSRREYVPQHSQGFRPSPERGGERRVVISAKNTSDQHEWDKFRNANTISPELVADEIYVPAEADSEIDRYGEDSYSGGRQTQQDRHMKTQAGVERMVGGAGIYAQPPGEPSSIGIGGGGPFKPVARRPPVAAAAAAVVVSPRVDASAFSNVDPYVMAMKQQRHRPLSAPAVRCGALTYQRPTVSALAQANLDSLDAGGSSGKETQNRPAAPVRITASSYGGTGFAGSSGGAQGGGFHPKQVSRSGSGLADVTAEPAAGKTGGPRKPLTIQTESANHAPYRGGAVDGAGAGEGRAAAHAKRESGGMIAPTASTSFVVAEFGNVKAVGPRPGSGGVIIGGGGETGAGDGGSSSGVYQLSPTAVGASRLDTSIGASDTSASGGSFVLVPGASPGDGSGGSLVRAASSSSSTRGGASRGMMRTSSSEKMGVQYKIRPRQILNPTADMFQHARAEQASALVAQPTATSPSAEGGADGESGSGAAGGERHHRQSHGFGFTKPTLSASQPRLHSRSFAASLRRSDPNGPQASGVATFVNYEKAKKPSGKPTMTQPFHFRLDDKYGTKACPTKTHDDGRRSRRFTQEGRVNQSRLVPYTGQSGVT